MAMLWAHGILDSDDGHWELTQIKIWDFLLIRIIRERMFVKKLHIYCESIFLSSINVCTEDLQG